MTSWLIVNAAITGLPFYWTICAFGRQCWSSIEPHAHRFASLSEAEIFAGENIAEQVAFVEA